MHGHECVLFVLNCNKGILDGRELRGWVGNSSASPSSILHNISVIRTAGDCPLTRALLLDTATNTRQFVTLAFEVRFPSRNILQKVLDNSAAPAYSSGAPQRTVLQSSQTIALL